MILRQGKFAIRSSIIERSVTMNSRIDGEIGDWKQSNNGYSTKDVGKDGKSY